MFDLFDHAFASFIVEYASGFSIRNYFTSNSFKFEEFLCTMLEVRDFSSQIWLVFLNPSDESEQWHFKNPHQDENFFVFRLFEDRKLYYTNNHLARKKSHTRCCNLRRCDEMIQSKYLEWFVSEDFSRKTLFCVRCKNRKICSIHFLVSQRHGERLPRIAECFVITRAPFAFWNACRQVGRQTFMNSSSRSYFCTLNEPFKIQ